MNRDLQRVLHEPLFSDIVCKRFRPRQAAEIGDACLDHGEFLRNQVRVGVIGRAPLQRDSV